MSRRGGSILLSKDPSESAALGERGLALLDSGYDRLCSNVAGTVLSVNKTAGW